MEHEKEYLKQNGRADLAAKVDAVCWTIGVGLGYDIKSFDPLTGEEIHIEVKTAVGPLAGCCHGIDHSSTNTASCRRLRRKNRPVEGLSWPLRMPARHEMPGR